MCKNGAEKCPGILMPKLKKKQVKPLQKLKTVWHTVLKYFGTAVL